MVLEPLHCKINSIDKTVYPLICDRNEGLMNVIDPLKD